MERKRNGLLALVSYERTVFERGLNGEGAEKNAFAEARKKGGSLNAV